MEDINIDEKLLKKIAQLKPVTPLTAEFIERLSGELRVKAVLLHEKKQVRFYKRWYFWTSMAVPITLMVLVVFASQDGFVYKQLPLINKVTKIDDQGFNELLLKNKVNVSDEKVVSDTISSSVVSMGEANIDLPMRAMRSAEPSDENNVSTQVEGQEPSMGVGQEIQPIFLKNDQPSVAPMIMPRLDNEPNVFVAPPTNKFILNNNLPDLPEKVAVYKASPRITPEVINNLYGFMGLVKPNIDTVPSDKFSLVGDQTFGLVVDVDVQKGKFVFSKNEPKWQIRFLRQIMMPKKIDAKEARVTADEFIKGIGYGFNEVGYVETVGSGDNWRFDYYQSLADLKVEDLKGNRKLLATVEVDSSLNKVSTAEINWFSYQISDYEVLTDKIRLEKIISTGGFNLGESTYVDQVVGEAKIILLQIDELLVPSLVFYLGQDNLYVPLVKELW